MVQITPIVVAIVAAASGASAFTRACPFPQVLCGYTLNNGVYGYTRSELIDALRRGGVDPNIPGVIEHSIFNCTNTIGGIATTRAQFCGNGKCVEPNPGNPEAPGPNAVCKP